ncbi:c-type cytochrome [Thiorhodovibrio frisius]|uniref:Cytochrome c553 n=1 Tax=Thiorhodovibrio frisius TaxID=631362 RepID=H8Z2Y7_9GAMM|nr:c-type cytochrome [Thiorhodovibrio frisius]EIC22759.1 cytochrome c553 [Thiorhodovibrio frisius]WPL22517.1 Cytochrome c552 [Thiorhodovibrio frisius]
MTYQSSRRLLRFSVLDSRPLLMGVVTILALVMGVTARGVMAAEATADGVYSYCVGCHGKYGVGGEGGRYPRIAGLPQPYIDAQIHAFKAQDRDNKPMIPIFKHVNFNEEVIDLVSAYIASMSVPNLGLWPYEPDPDALAAFDSREGYAAAGKQAYKDQCASCHGAQGQGADSGDAPPLVAQYPAYLAKQIRDFATGERKHAHSADCGAPDAATADAIINHLVELGR